MKQEPENTTASEPTAAGPSAPETTNEHALTDLMSVGEHVGKAGKAKAPDLEGQALRAAEAAIAEGERALATARAQMQKHSAQQRRGGSRELILRGLLLVNVLAMVVVASWPTAKARTEAAPQPPTHTSAPETTPPNVALAKEPYNRALQAAESGNFAVAVKILDGYLADSPRMAPGQKLNVLMALAYYAQRSGDDKKAQESQRLADALQKSHSLPEDLVASAKAAIDNHDQEGLRRIWARFLLQQRQIPTWLYKHVAEAYLQLGDSYRQEAATAAERVRLEELQQAAERLREEAMQAGGRNK